MFSRGFVWGNRKQLRGSGEDSGCFSGSCSDFHFESREGLGGMKLLFFWFGLFFLLKASLRSRRRDSLVLMYHIATAPTHPPSSANLAATPETPAAF